MLDLDGHYWGEGVVKRAAHVVRLARNAGSSAVGYGYAKAAGAQCSRTEGLTLACTDAQRFSRFGGMTIGNVWVTKDRWADTTPNLRRHERRHSSQWAVFGSSFPALYGVASLASAASYRFRPRRGCSDQWACNNVFERHANLKWGRYEN